MSTIGTTVTSLTTASDRHLRGDAPLVARAHLFVAMSCASPLEHASRHGLDGLDEVRIGRGRVRSTDRHAEDGARCLTLSLADPRVSSAHARLVRHEAAWIFEDLGSKNGSAVNGVSVGSAVMADRDCLQIGQTLLIFRASLPTPLQAPTDLEAMARVPVLATLLPLLARELDVLAVAAESHVPVLLVSETGTGKELLARAVHALSRRKGDFVPVNCGGLPATLVESMLFGHKRGAFSGAVADQTGLTRAADGGTLLLDEVGDMSLAAQAAILRTMQDGEVLPVGATQPLHVDLRVISATHHDLEQRVWEGTFREDLLSRLCGFTFRLPPLRERREDIGLLVGVLLRQMAPNGHTLALSPEAGTALLRYDWPRNVRELGKSLAHAVVLAGNGRIEVEHLPETVRDGARADGRSFSSSDEVRARLLGLLTESRGNVSVVAHAMRTSRSQVHRWMKRFAIQAGEFRR
jgi:sigma-54 dependent transcriptional regulator, acetoin dehydrogenase operon transcriptional activator AcoR